MKLLRAGLLTSPGAPQNRFSIPRLSASAARVHGSGITRSSKTAGCDWATSTAASSPTRTPSSRRSPSARDEMAECPHKLEQDRAYGDLVARLTRHTAEVANATATRRRRADAGTQYSGYQELGDRTARLSHRPSHRAPVPSAGRSRRRSGLARRAAIAVAYRNAREPVAELAIRALKGRLAQVSHAWLHRQHQVAASHSARRVALGRRPYRRHGAPQDPPPPRASPRGQPPDIHARWPTRSSRRTEASGDRGDRWRCRRGLRVHRRRPTRVSATR